ncbi:triple tyrosine motif-containing protein [Mucilaginibacter arboris]|uniref:Transcriptional regulator n=1 Tax=Mucilaginibacter arboris TaxID=2682090 RepID=A0A7K1T116_9SPHI|nr:triple tyrosine motif-containing protein [Mucilaginibacter arboris]MVN23245.1 transcriptional regulator [Mucilaginibacter arboris]
MRKITGLLLVRIILLLLFFQFSKAGNIQRIGTPFVDNYTKGMYQAGNQNWSVTKDVRGIMYFGNSEGLLSFDGKYWQLNRMPNRLIVRAVAADRKDRIYAGGFGEFGYWKYSNTGLLTYHSLIGLVPTQYQPKDEIWKIYVDGSKVIFQSFASIFIYENGKISVVKEDNSFLFLFKAGTRYFAEVISKGLFELKGQKLFPVPNSSLLSNMAVLSVLPFKKNSFLIGTAKSGLFIYDSLGIKPWNNQANSFLKTFQLNNGALVLNHYYAFGTILNGIIIIDENGNIVQQVNKTSGLQNNTVLSVFTDQEQNLWTGLDNGIDRIEINSPLYFYLDKTGKFGTVYSSIIYKNKIYIGTNQGLFYSDWNESNPRYFQHFDFLLVPNSQGQVWDLALIDGQLFCGHNEGTYLVNGTHLNKISGINGGWMISKLNNTQQNVLVQGTYTGLVIYRKDQSGNWHFSNKVDHFGEPSRYVEPDNKGNFWVSHAYKGLYKLKLSDDLKEAKSVRMYDQKNGLPDNFHIGIFNLEGQPVFATNLGFYRYDEISDQFIKYQQLNSVLGSFAFSNKVIKAGDKKYWFINHGKIALADLTKPGQLKIDSISFSELNGRMLETYENISRINNSFHLISLDDGFVIYHARDTGTVSKIVLPNVLIRKVENTSNTTDKIAVTENDPIKAVFPYSKNNLRISYSLPYYHEVKIRYQYQLSGLNDKWSDWGNQTQKEFINLPPGKYQFKVRAKVNDQNESGEAVYSFVILSPWYNTIWAYFFYALFFVLLVWQLRKYYYHNLEMHQNAIQKKLQKEKEEYLKQEALANQQRMVELRNEQLQTELASKSRELTNSAMNIVYKNELLQKIREELTALHDDQGKRISADNMKKIQKVIDEGKVDERDWNLFETSFNETHESFFKKLKVGHPDLVPNDLKLCAFLRMNMNSKEIASLLNITLRGVEIRRYRLRKKLNLEHDQNLVEFLMGL